MKRWFVRIAIILLVLLLLAVGAGWLASEPRPNGTPSPEADALARKMERAVNVAAWARTGALWWNFGDRHTHLWDKKRGFGRVRWGDAEVLLHIATKTGIAKEAGAEVTGSERDALLEKAYALWANDSFWLNPVAKLFDPGTTRSLVTLEDGRNGLMVSYGEGGVTPGDAYVWIVGEDGTPVAWKMWVGIIPIGGIELTWDRWKNLSTGAKVSTLHRGTLTLEMKDVLGAPSVTDIENEDPFAELARQTPVPATQPATPATQTATRTE